MKIEIENLICNWADEIPGLIIRLLNVMTLADNEEELKAAVQKLIETTRIGDFFEIGYGRHHLWVHQKKLSNGEPMKCRIIKVNF